MSRILRRPMFRGGPVNSRGTGITSNLGYNNGGRVGYGNGNVVLGKDLIANNIFTGKPQTQDYKERQEYFQQYKPKTLAEVRAEYENRLKEQEDNLLFSIGVDEQTPGSYGDKVAKDLKYFSDPEGGQKKFFQDADAEEKQKRKEAEEFGVILPNLLSKQLETPSPNRNQVRVAKELDEKDILEADQKKFAEMLGKKKARIQDASNMALGFAGRAFEDEATTKSALGKFFADEAKRPSEAAKVDQAAASLAINKYIKGEISKAEMEKLVMLNRAKTNLGDKAYISSALEKATSFSNGVKDGIQRNPERRGESIRFKDVTSDQMTKENFKPGPEDIGIIFIETDTQRAYSFNNNLQQVDIYSR